MTCLFKRSINHSQTRNGKTLVVHNCDKRECRCIPSEDERKSLGLPDVVACESCKLYVEAKGITEPVGTRLHEIIAECGIIPSESCQCRSWQIKMNGWGIRGCKEHRPEILEHLRHASESAGWLDMLRVAARGYLSHASILDAAITRARLPVFRHLYRTMNEIYADTWAWSNQLRDEPIIGVCGVHRSGIPVASAFSSHRNIHYVDWHALISNDPTWQKEIRRRLGNPHPRPDNGYILVIDDTTWSGGTFRTDVKPHLKECQYPIKYGALYYGESGRREIDFGLQQLYNVRQTYQFNIFHDAFTSQQSFDLDGIFCSDVPSHEIDHDENKYVDWMRSVKPLIQPTHPLGCIITGRLEKYRTTTMEWLATHGIRYRRLEMYKGAETNMARNSAHHLVTEWKADVYASLAYSTLFVESDDRQAETVAGLTGKSVLAWPSQQKWNCD